MAADSSVRQPLVHRESPTTPLKQQEPVQEASTARKAEENSFLVQAQQLLGASLGVSWVVCGLVSYTVLSVLVGLIWHSRQAATLWRSEVSMTIYDRSTAMFTTAFCIDVLSAIFVSRSTKLDYVALPAFIKGMASITNLLVRTGHASMAFTSSGRIIMLQRYVCWMHTTPTVLMLVRMIATSLTLQDTLYAIMWDEIMLVTGVLAATTTGRWQVFFTFVTHITLFPVAVYLWRGLREACENMAVQKRAKQAVTTWSVYSPYVMPVFMQCTWVGFGLTWDLGMLHLVSNQTEELFNVSFDFIAKVLFSSSLMLSSFKSIEWRREGVMRSIEDTHKQKLIEELQDVLEQKDRFMSSVSHELRTPLNGIIGISEGMLAGCCGALTEQVRRQLYVVRTSGARLLALVNDVMDASALRTGSLVLRQEKIMLRQVVDDIFDLTRSLVTTDVELQNAVPADLAIIGDTDRVVQILNNLLGNAAKFTHRGNIRVSARHYEESNKVAISVHDTGIGIPKYKLQSIFLPFEQVDVTVSRKYGGFGLGLNIVRELVKAHGGDIWVQSVEHRGSCFTFLLPAYEGRASLEAAGRGKEVAMPADAAKPSQQDGKDFMPAMVVDGQPHYDRAQLTALAANQRSKAPAQPIAQNGDGVSSAPASSSGAGEAEAAVNQELRPSHYAKHGTCQILSVDDDATNQAVVQLLLSTTGHSVLCLFDGKSVIDHLDKCDVLPDLMLLDIMMPGMNGYEVLQWLQEHNPSLLKRLPIIMVSARTGEADVVRGLNNGAVDYVSKPLRRTEFLARVAGRLAQAQEMAREAANLIKPAGPGSVLCIGDDAVSQSILQGVLSSAGFSYIQAETAEQAVSYVAPDNENLPDLVLLDQSLPDIDSMELLTRIRDNFTMLQVPVIVLASRADEDAVSEALGAGANDFMAKPFRRSELLARVRMHLRSTLRRRTSGRGIAESPAAGRQAGSVLSSSSRNDTRPPTPKAADSFGGLRGTRSTTRDTPRSSVTELPELGAGAQSYSCVPVLAGSLRGMQALAAKLHGAQLARLLGGVRDSVTMLYEKYAVIKVEASDDAFVLMNVQEEVEVVDTFQRMLKLATELQGTLESSISVPGAGPGALGITLALHVGAVQSGVVGERKPQYRYFGEALQVAKAAVKDAPDGALVVTSAAVALLGGPNSPIVQKFEQLPNGSGAGALWQLQGLNQSPVKQAPASAAPMANGPPKAAAAANGPAHGPLMVTSAATLNVLGRVQPSMAEQEITAPAGGQDMETVLEYVEQRRPQQQQPQKREQRQQQQQDQQQQQQQQRVRPLSSSSWHPGSHSASRSASLEEATVLAPMDAVDAHGAKRRTASLKNLFRRKGQGSGSGKQH